MEKVFLQVEEKTTVKTRWNTDIDVRNGVISDETGSLQFAFWRQLVQFPLNAGQVMKITNGIMSKTTNNSPNVTG